MIDLVKYSDNDAQAWDQLVVLHAANGTIFHTRKFLAYHTQKKFEDHSLLIYKSGKLIAVIAVALSNDGEYFSHPGTSCGGPVIHRGFFKIETIVEIATAVMERFGNRLGMRLCENNLIPCSNSILLYHFSKFLKTKLELTAYRKLDDLNLIESIPQARTRTAVRKIFAEANRFESVTSESGYLQFHEMLKNNLEKHKAEPTHNAPELLRLSELLEDRQNLVVWRDSSGKVGCGVWMIRASELAWHAQYIAKDQSCALTGIVEATLIKAMQLAKERNARFFSLGISTEGRGAHLNLGLSNFKEKLGCEFENRFLLIPPREHET